MSHVPPRRGRRKGTVAAFGEQMEQSKRMKKSKGRDEALPASPLVHVHVDAQHAAARMRAMVDAMRQSFDRALLTGRFDDYVPPPLPRRKAAEGFKAFRAWRVCRDESGAYGLASTAHDFLWDGPVLRDTDPPTERERPALWGQPPGNIGIHAYNDVRDALCHVPTAGSVRGQSWVVSVLRTASLNAAPGPKIETLNGGVIGEVLLFGSVVVHTHGYRAQCAMIRSLYVPADTYLAHPGIVEALAARYGCDVHADYTKWLGGNGGNDR